MDIVFATNNQHKLQEIRELISKNFRILSLSDVNITTEIPEDYPTLHQNAAQKAWFIFSKVNMNCFADDTGLEVDALNGEPGVYSARYSHTGNPVFPEMGVVEGNIHKLLLVMKGAEVRSARFRTVIVLVFQGKEYTFEGVAEGRIAERPVGGNGFGYDPVFVPLGYDLTYAEMDLSEKNRISHRAKAVDALISFLCKSGSAI